MKIESWRIWWSCSWRNWRRESGRGLESLHRLRVATWQERAPILQRLFWPEVQARALPATTARKLMSAGRWCLLTRRNAYFGRQVGVLYVWGGAISYDNAPPKVDVLTARGAIMAASALARSRPRKSRSHHQLERVLGEAHQPLSHWQQGCQCIPAIYPHHTVD